MDYFITPKKEWFRGGVNLEVTLRFTLEEHRIINRHNMHSIIILPRKDDQSFPFAYFYKRTTHWHCENIHEATLFREELNKEFENFRRLLLSNSRELQPVHIDFTPQVWNFFEDERFSHMWVMAQTGSGKTTFLSALINEDLKKVAAGKASVVIIDSQGEHLSSYLAHNKRFAPGGDLEGKLIYLEPDLHHPLKLNIFDFTNYASLPLTRQVEELEAAEDRLNLFVGATIGDTSGHSKTILSFCMKALVHIPVATIHTLKSLLVKGTFDTLADTYPALDTLETDTRDFLTTRMFKSYGPSLSALMNRLDTFTRNAYLEAMFKKPDNTFRLHELLEEPHVIIINTNEKRLRAATGLFGRFFIAAVLDVVTRRQGGGFPAYVFLDEAQQYIFDEPAIVELIQKARRQNIGLTIAHHKHSDVSDSVREALHDAAIHARPAGGHKWKIMVRQGVPVDVSPNNVNFEREPYGAQMTPPEWQAILTDMHKKFCYEPSAEPRAQLMLIAAEPAQNAYKVSDEDAPDEN